MALNARQVETSKPKDNDYKLADGGGLYLLVKINGSKYWRMKYRFAGKEKKLSLGVYPGTSLADARSKRDDARKTLAAGNDPGEEKKAQKNTQKLTAENTFASIATEWHQYKRPHWTPKHADTLMETLKLDIFPYIGTRLIARLTPMDMLQVLRKMESRGVLYKLRKTRQVCGQVFRYAMATGRAESDPCMALSNTLAAPTVNHFAHLQVDELPDFLRALSAFEPAWDPIMIIATRLLMLTGVRTLELRAAEWREFDLEQGLWEIPAERMKKRRLHVVPLCRQAVDLLRQLQVYTGYYRLAFPGRNDCNKPRAANGITFVIDRLGYKGKVTGHGFRHTMSTILHEQGFNTAWVEIQLAHADKNSIRGTYNHAQYLDGRREMMQWYADYIDSLEHGGAIPVLPATK
ncbi:tyrosine-type recombinase/integrase [Yersinia enterocolitica]|uniref:tyrosine-type recombinase/integrase n=1 Tax=Yersinia enterocolitica TaxID=630 RepID=UPI003CFFA2EA